MEPKEYIAAIDFGSSKIVGMVGIKGQNMLEVVAVEKHETSSCVRRGNIHNVEEAAIQMKKIVSLLENRVHQKLEKIYVGVSGQSVISQNEKAYIRMDHETAVNEVVIDNLIEACRLNKSDSYEILDIIPNEYKLDGKKTEINPNGVTCTEIEGHFKLILGRPTLLRNISRVVEERTGLTLAGYKVSPLAAASVLLSEADKVLGCALVDFGAATTTVSVYKDGLLRKVTVIPFGGQVVTRDISSANLVETDAEKLKNSYGSAIFNPDSDNKTFSPRSSGSVEGPKIDLHTLNNIIEARMVEIIQNVWAQIEASGFSKQLGAGIYITGGASQLRNITDLIKRETGVEAKKAQITRHITNGMSTSESMQNPAYAVVLGLLMTGTQNCVKELPKVEVPVVITEADESDDFDDDETPKVTEPKKGKKKSVSERFGLGNLFGSLFGDIENNDSEMA